MVLALSRSSGSLRHWCIAMACAGLSMLEVAYATQRESSDMRNLLTYDWSHMAGAEVTAEGLRVEGLGRMIVPADDADYSATSNPPINLRGPVLQVAGDFSLSARLQVPDEQGAYLTYYGRLPLNQDEWRQEGYAVTLGLDNGKLIVELQEGIAYPDRHEYFVSTDTEVEVTLTRLGQRLVVSVDDSTVAVLADPGLFESGEIVFGAHADVDRQFLLTNLTARGMSEDAEVDVVERTLPVVEPGPGSLRRLAEKNYPHLRIGTAVSEIPLLDDREYARTLASQFNMVTPENAMKFQFIHPRPGRYAFADADAIVDFAERNGMAVHGHTLAWKEALPRWVTEPDHSDERIREILAEHIATVVGRYKGRVESWDVVNEPLEPFGPGLRTESPWYRAMGEDYIAFALREAHRADPQARLYINDFALEERSDKSDSLYRLAKSLLAQGVPLHGIGFQMHEDMQEGYEPVSAEAFRENVQRFIDLGLEVRISEMDVNLHDDESAERLQAQAEYYRSILELARDEKAFTAFSTWGFSDRYSSLQGWWEADDLGNGLIFDTDHEPKPAYHSLRAALDSREAGRSLYERIVSKVLGRTGGDAGTHLASDQ